MPCFEIAMFRIHEERIDDFQRIEPAIKAECRQRFQGLETTDTLRNVAEPRTFVHVWRWASKEEAVRAADAFPTLPSAPGFMACIEEMLLMTHAEA